MNNNNNHLIKKIFSNRAECDHIDNSNDTFKLSEHMKPNFFNSELAEELMHKQNLANYNERKKLNELIFKSLPFMKKLTKNKNIENENDSIKNRKKSLNNGKFYNYLISDVFEIDLILIYLDNSNDESIFDVLINKIYSKFIHQSLFYLPQLCVMLNYKIHMKSLQSYLLDRCINQIKFSLQITWLLTSFIEEKNSLINKEIYDKFLQKIEETLVNGIRSSLNNYVQYDNNDNNDIINKSVQKQIRLNYFNICIDFYMKLKNMCEDLRNFEKGEKRKNELNNFLNKFNDEIINQRNEFKDNVKFSCLFYGIILPFNDTKSTNDNDNNLIVRIIPEYSFCFSTKERVPTKICVECVKVNECKKWEKLYKNNNNKENEDDSSSISVNNNNNNNIFYNKDSISNISSNNIIFNNNNNRESKISSLKNDSIRISNFDKEHFEIIKERESKLHEFYNNLDKKNNNNNNIQNNNNNTFNNFIIIDSNENEKKILELKQIFGKTQSELTNELKENSPFKLFKTYQIKNFIAKANDDLRQEHLAMQLIKTFESIFKKKNLPLKLHSYEILITSNSSGLLEFLNSTSSIDGIKKTFKKLYNTTNLNYFYHIFYNKNFISAQKNFIESLAGYCLICYYLQIKDRHNGNILLDLNGNLIHIDFGFILGISPGNLNFESAPFKLTKEYVEIMGGENSNEFKYFKKLICDGMIECKNHVEILCKIIEIMSHGSTMPCFDKKDVKKIIDCFRERFYEKKNDEEIKKIVDEMIYKSNDNFWTNKYDLFQQVTNNILP
jgi:phosphatidylinositol 4-kinase